MRLKLPLVAAAALLIATPALADYQQRDAANATQTFSSFIYNLVHHPKVIFEGMFGSTPKPVSVDTNGYVNVNVMSGGGGGGGSSLSTLAGSATRSVTTSSQRVALPTADPAVLIENTGSSDAFFALGDNTVVATTSSFRLSAGHSIVVAAGTNTYLAAITSTGTTSLSITTGTAAPTIAGGGGGGGSGGGATTIVDGGSVTTGTTTDAACSSDTATCTQIALMKRELQRLSTLITTMGSPFQAGGSIGNSSFGISGNLPGFAAIPTFKVDQTTPGTTDSVSVKADELHHGEVGGHTTIAGASFTTTATTTALADGQLLANSATAGSVTPLTFTVCRLNAGTGMVRRARIKISDTGLAGKSLYLKLYRDAPTLTNGDHNTWLTTESNYLGQIAVTLDQHFSDFEKGIGAPDQGSEINFDCATGSQNIYGLIVANGASGTLQGSKTLTAVLEALVN